MGRLTRRALLKILLAGGLLIGLTLKLRELPASLKRSLLAEGLLPVELAAVDGDFDQALFEWAVANASEEERRWRYEWVMVIDLEKCDGCGLCEEACIAAHEPLPGQTWMKVYWLKAQDGSITPLPRPCMQCQRAPCVSVCPVGANYYNEDGVVIIDKDRCIGCRMCMAACPYGARYFNWSAPPDRAREPHGEEVPHPVGVVEKCMLCYAGLERGELPACARGCPMKAIYLGDRRQDVVTNGVETRRLFELLAERDAFRLFEELGTDPRVYYLPGRRGGRYLEGARGPLQP
jgi:molybdopterin-containing oxidoreductase family iron-sulfur binding subunit